jgi:hypothetical protein
MFRRVFLLLPGLLALWLAALTGSASGPHATAIECGADCSALSIATTPLNHHNDSTVAFSQWPDEDDYDRHVPTSRASPWAPFTSSGLACVASDVPRGIHSSCTALPRGPPSV